MTLWLLVACGELPPPPPPSNEAPVLTAKGHPGQVPKPPPERPVRPARPPPPPLPPAEPRVVALFEDAETMMPGPAHEALEATVALGEDALPSLLKLATDTRDSNRLFLICEAVKRLDVRDDRVARYLEPKLRSADDLVISTCGQAIAHSLPVGSPDLELVWSIVADPSARCITRRNLAAALREPEVCDAMRAFVRSAGCDRMTGVYGLGSCPGSQDVLLGLAGDHTIPLDIRESALMMLRELEPAPEGRDLYLWWIREGDALGPSNAKAFALELLGNVGTAADLPLLHQVVRDDPYQGEGIDAVNARKAIRAIERRAVR